MTRIIFVAFLVGVVCFMGCQQTPQQTESVVEKATLKEDPISHGKYLVTALACNDCHTPFKMGPNGPEPDMTKMLSGHPESMPLPPPPETTGPWVWGGSASNTAFYGPWGITYSPNLTPDQNTGMGIWTEDIFIKALRTGKHFGTSRPIMPPMPWQSYSQLTDDDLKAMYAFLRTIPPIKNTVPDYTPPKQQQ
jgi:hypothetical protein